MKLYPLPSFYAKIIKSVENVKLSIIGKDPYPTAPMGIPFCKSNWKEFTAYNCSGKYVIESLGSDLAEAEILYNSPDDLFCNLAEKGIVFLNASYYFLDSSTITKKHMQFVENSLAINLPIIKRSENVLLCGQAKVLNSILKTEFEEAIHPDVRNKAMRPELWETYWAKDKLKTKFNL